MLFPFTHSGYVFTVNAMKDSPKDYEFPRLADFWITGVSSIVFSVLSVVLKSLFYQMFLPFCKEQKNEKIREIRSTKAAGCMYKTIYFLWATAWGYIVLKD